LMRAIRIWGNALDLAVRAEASVDLLIGEGSSSI
jgi:hypothetical protein